MMTLDFTPGDVTFRAGTSVAGVYRFTDAFKPHIHPLRTPRGHNVTSASPHDHKHHKALMYALRAEDVNFWEETATLPTEVPGIERHLAFLEVTGSGECVGFTKSLHWCACDGSLPTFDETRRISCRHDPAARAFVWTWETRLTALRDLHLVQSQWSHGLPDGTKVNYHGFGIRFRREFGGMTRGHELRVDGEVFKETFQQQMGARAKEVTFIGIGGATATAVVSGGVVTGVTVTNPGSAYQSGPTVSFSGGGGTGVAATAFLYPSSDSANWPQTLGWRRGDAPLGPADGNRGSVWPVLGGKLVETLGVPVAFVAVGRGGMPIEAWRDGDGRQMLWPLLNTLNYIGPSGARAVLWHQGESNGHMTTAGPYYNEINALISRSRSSGWAVDRVVAQASILGDAATNLAVVGDQAKIADDFAYVYPGPNTDQMLNAAGG